MIGYFRTIPFLFLLWLAGCGVTTYTSSLKYDNSLIRRLSNRGPVALSTQNPFLAANLLVAKEMARSKDVEGFIRHRGGPAALEVRKELFEPLMLSFYYPENKEYFTFEDIKGSWLIRGPNLMGQQKFQEVAKLLRNVSGPPALNFPGESTSTSSKAYASTPSSPTTDQDTAAGVEGEDPFLKKLDSYEQQQVAGEENPNLNREQAVTSFKSPQATTSLAPSSLDEIISEEGGHTAEVTPKGDLVHYVTFSGESLSMIARWYTRDRANASRLARINRLTNPDKLRLGDVIIVPSYLLRNTGRLTEGAVQKMSELAQREQAMR